MSEPCKCCETCKKNDANKYQIDKIYQFLEKEIALFWTRFWIFGALITAILVGWYNVVNNNKLSSYNFLKILLPFFASIIALIQTLINRGAKRWLDYWQNKLKDFKEYNIYDKSELKCYNKIDFYGDAYSPAKLGVMFTDLVCLNCILFTFFQIVEFNNLSNKDCNSAFLLFSFFINCPLIIYHLIEILNTKFD